MNEYEKGIADGIRAAVNEWSDSTERSEQSKQFRLGPSDIGYCSERVRRMLDQQVPETEVDWNKAFIGTWLGDGLETAYKAKFPHVLTQVTLVVSIKGDLREFTMEGHADVIDPLDPLVIDFKAKDGLDIVRRHETADQSYQFQRHLYGLGAWQSGLFAPGTRLDDVKVGNAYYDRSGREAVPHVQIEPFSMEVVEEATRWLDDVVYAFLHEEEARKEPSREVCERTCGFFAKCRGYDTDVEGLITDRDHLTAVDLILEARELESRAKRMKNTAQVALKDVSGHTATHTVRWTEVGGGTVSYQREPYMRLGITKKK